MGEVKYGGTPTYGRQRASAWIDVGAAAFAGWGETHEQARQDLLRDMERHMAEMREAMEMVRRSQPPAVPLTR
jgi:hypothetical protein